jgi:uncharacterized membrane protein
VCGTVIAAVVSLLSYNYSPAGVYVAVAYTVIVTVMVVCRKIDSRCLPLVLLGVSASLVLQVTMYGNDVVGTDARSEAGLMEWISANGWSPQLNHLYSTSVVIAFIGPALIKIGISVVWIMKLVLPLFLIFVPFVLFFIYHKFFCPVVSYLAVLFFMTMPAFFLGVTMIGRQEVAELFLAVLLLSVVAKIPTHKKTILISTLLVIIFVAHYTLGVMAIGMILVLLVVKMVYQVTRKWMQIPMLEKSTTTIKQLLIPLLVCAIPAVVWAAFSGGGIIITGLSSVAGMPEAVANIYGQAKYQDLGALSYMVDQEPVVQTAIGMDFLDASIGGKVFRVLQFITEILLVLGLFIMVTQIKHKPWVLRTRIATKTLMTKIIVWSLHNYTKTNRISSLEFCVSSVFCFVIIAACVVLPHFSQIIGAARFYHLSLLLLSPMPIIGLCFLFRRHWGIVAAVLLSLYLVFTSGLVFELTKNTTTDFIDTPYSVVLSNDRLNLYGIFTKSDSNCAKWLEDNVQIGQHIAVDGNTANLLRRYIPNPYPVMMDYGTRLSYSTTNPPDNCYVFLSDWNTRNNKVVIYNGNGLRETINITGQMKSTLESLPVVYRDGQSVIRFNVGEVER